MLVRAALLMVFCIATACAKIGPDTYQVTGQTIEEGLKTGRIIYNAEGMPLDDEEEGPEYGPNP